MSLQTINLGTYANDGTGDDLRTAFTKVNANFAILNTEAGIAGAVNLGSGTGVFKDQNINNLEFKTLTSTGNTVSITNTATTVNLESTFANVQADTNPTLGGNLHLNNFSISGGDVQTTIYGADPRIDSSLLSLLISNNSNFDIDLGNSFTSNTGGYNLDFGSTFGTVANDVDFGSFDTNPLGVSGGYDLTLTGNLTVAGGYSLTFNLSGNTQLTLPTSGTVATASYNLGNFAATTSNGLLNIITDPSGTGRLVFNASPAFTGTVTANNISASGYIYTTGNFAVNNTAFEVDASTGNVVVAGSISSTSAPGSYQFDVTSDSSKITLNNGDTIDFHNFSGSILVNCWTSGTVTQYLCGSGSTPIAIGSSRVTATGTMSSNGGINGYTFTATETGIHSFFVVRTRNGA
jgi:hypothetical protein